MNIKNNQVFFELCTDDIKKETVVGEFVLLGNGKYHYCSFSDVAYTEENLKTILEHLKEINKEKYNELEK